MSAAKTRVIRHFSGRRHGAGNALLAALGLVATCVMVAPTTAHAWNLHADLNGQNNQFVNTSAGAVSSDMAATGTYLRLAVAPDQALAIEASWHTFNTNAYTLGVLYAESDVDVLTVGASWTLFPLPWLRPFGRVAAGLGHTAVSFQQGETATGTALAPALALGAGFELLVPPGAIFRGKDFTVGFVLEFGWMHVFNANVDLTVDRATTPATEPAIIKAGGLGWSAFTTRFGLVVRI